MGGEQEEQAGAENVSASTDDELSVFLSTNTHVVMVDLGV